MPSNLNIQMENDIVIVQKNGLIMMVKTINALKIQIIQLENQVRELRLNLVGVKK